MGTNLYLAKIAMDIVAKHVQADKDGMRIAQHTDSAAIRRIRDAVSLLNAGSAAITEWDESMIRQLVDTVKVLSADRILVRLRGGAEIEQPVEEAQVKWYA